MFFKHKYITQPTVTPADAIVNALTKLQDAIQGIQHLKNDAHFEALRRLEQTLQPKNKQIIKMEEQVKLPRVEQQIELTTQQVPRVRFDESPPTVHDPPPRLIVKIVEPPPKPILKPPKYIDDSIAVQVCEQRFQPQTTVNESIADRVPH